MTGPAWSTVLTQGDHPRQFWLQLDVAAALQLRGELLYVPGNHLGPAMLQVLIALEHEAAVLGTVAEQPTGDAA